MSEYMRRRDLILDRWVRRDTLPADLDEAARWVENDPLFLHHAIDALTLADPHELDHVMQYVLTCWYRSTRSYDTWVSDVMDGVR